MYDDVESQVENWSGKSVADLPVNDLYDYPEAADSDRLRSSVPEEYRGPAKGPEVPVSDTNSLDTVKKRFEVLAVDTAGNALTRETATRPYMDADGFTYKITPKEQAFAQLAEFRSLPADAKTINAEAGNSYTGPVLSMTEERVYQQVGNQIVAHERAMLTGEKLDPREAGASRQPIEIRYQHGEVGVVTPASDHAMTRSEQAPKFEATRLEPLVVAKQIAAYTPKAQAAATQQATQEATKTKSRGMSR